MGFVSVAAVNASAQTSKTGRISEGLLANRPSTCAAGDVFLQTNSPYLSYTCGPTSTWTPSSLPRFSTNGQITFSSTSTGLSSNANLTFDTTNGVTLGDLGGAANQALHIASQTSGNAITVDGGQSSFSLTGTGSAPVLAFSFVTGTNPDISAAVFGEVSTVMGSSNNPGGMAGVVGSGVARGSGTLDGLFGVQGQLETRDGASGTVTLGADFYAAGPGFVESTTFTQMNGLYVEDQHDAHVTSSYGIQIAAQTSPGYSIYSAGGPTHLGPIAGDFSAPANGDMWYNTVSGKFRCRENGSTVNCVGSGGGGGAFSDLTSGTNTSAAMVVGNGASLVASGTGFITATSTLNGVTAASNFTSGGLVSAAGNNKTLQAAQLSGDVTTTSGGTATTLANIPSAVPMAGYLLATNIAAPSSPASGKNALFSDSTDLRFHDKNASGSIGTTVVANTGASNQFLTAISAAGVVSRAQPNLSNIAAGASPSGNFNFAGATTLEIPTASSFVCAIAGCVGEDTGAAVMYHNFTNGVDSIAGSFPVSLAPSNGDIVKYVVSGTNVSLGKVTASTLSGLSGMTAGYIPLAATSTTITSNSHFDDGITTASTITSTEAIVGPSFTTNSSGAGYFGCTAGTLPGVGSASTVRITCPATATAYEFVMPLAAGTGLLQTSNSANVVTGSIDTPAYAAQTDGSTVTWAIGSQFISSASLLFTTHGGSRTLNITNPINGGRYRLKITQDGTGGEGLTLGTGCTWKVSGAGGGAITPSTGANAIDVLDFDYDGGSSTCNAIFTKNFT